MNIFQAVILGIVQGLAEFMPISSSGHLILFQKLFRITEPTMTFDIILHLATLIPLIVVMWEQIFELIKKPFQKMTFLIIVATIPAVVAALFFEDFIENMFMSGSFLPIGFIVTAVFMLYSDGVSTNEKNDKDITFVDALLIGCMQAIAIAPGISRSGSTIAGSLSCKLKRETAAKFSFLMSVPVIVGALVLQGKDIITGDVVAENVFTLPTLFGFVAAMLTGYISIRFMLKLIKEAKLKYFAYYLFALAFLITFDQFVTKIYF